MKSYEFHDRAQERIVLLKQMLIIALLLFLKAKPQPRTRCRNLALEVRGSLSFFINCTTPFHNNHTVSIMSPPCANSVRKRRRISRHGCHLSNCYSGTICFKSGRHRPILTKVTISRQIPGQQLSTGRDQLSFPYSSLLIIPN